MSSEKSALVRIIASRKRSARRPALRLVRGRARAAGLADVIRREVERVQKGMRGFAIALGLKPGPGAAQAATLESGFWLDQLPKEGGELGPDAWRELPKRIGARVRCLDAYAHVAWMLTSASEGAGYTRIEWASSIDASLEVLRRESSRVGPRPASAAYRRYVKRQGIIEQIGRLKIELKSDEAS
jgi:hypothetical protein